MMFYYFNVANAYLARFAGHTPKIVKDDGEKLILALFESATELNGDIVALSRSLHHLDHLIEHGTMKTKGKDSGTRNVLA